jgi:hypothetical protein
MRLTIWCSPTGSGLGAARRRQMRPDAAMRGDRRRRSASELRVRRLPATPSACTLSCGPGCRGFESHRSPHPLESAGQKARPTGRALRFSFSAPAALCACCSVGLRRQLDVRTAVRFQGPAFGPGCRGRRELVPIRRWPAPAWSSPELPRDRKGHGLGKVVARSRTTRHGRGTMRTGGARWMSKLRSGAAGA